MKKILAVLCFCLMMISFPAQAADDFKLDAEITVGEKLVQVEYDYPAFHLSMGCYRCSLASGHLTLKEHEAARWLAPADLRSVAWLPADVFAVDALLRTIENTSTSK